MNTSLTYSKDYYIKNATLIKERSRLYRLKNAEKLKEYHAKRYENKRDFLLKQKSEYFQNNKKEINERRKIKLAGNEELILRNRLRSRLHIALKRKGLRKNNLTMKYIGCSKEKLRSHIESQFVEGMNWGNHGTWHIDHIVPVSSFDLSKEENIYKMMHYSNLQPLFAEDNLKKRDKIYI